MSATRAEAPRRTDAFALLAAFAVLVVGVGALANREAGGGGALVSRIRSAAEATGSFRFVMTQKFTGPGTNNLATGPPFTLAGTVDVDNGRTLFVTTINAPQVKTKCTYVATEDDIYVSVHPSRRAKIGAAWLRADVKTVLGAQTYRIRPDKLYDNAQGLFDDLAESGSGTVRGVATTKYAGQVPVAEILPAISDNPSFDRFGDRVPVALYVDQKNLMRRLTIDITAGRGFALRLTMDFFDYGKPVAISTPPPAQVKDGDAQQTATACFPGAVRTP